MTCPDCGQPCELVGKRYGSWAGAGFVSPTDVYLCDQDHVWARVHPPVIKGSVADFRLDDA